MLPQNLGWTRVNQGVGSQSCASTIWQLRYKTQNHCGFTCTLIPFSSSPLLPSLGDALYKSTTMTWRHSFRKIYCLDTLDTRFSIPANVPPKHANTELQEIPSIPNSSEERVSNSRPDGAPTQSLPDARPSLWNTWEFYSYYFVFITCVPLMFKAVYDVSQRMQFYLHSRYIY